MKYKYRNFHLSIDDIGICSSVTKLDEDDKYYPFLMMLYSSIFNYLIEKSIKVTWKYLLEFKSTDNLFLFDKLKENDSWKYVDMMNDFDYIKFVDNNIKEFGEISLIEMTNHIIELFELKDSHDTTKDLIIFKNDIQNINELYKCYENFADWFKLKYIKVIENTKIIIECVIDDLNGKREDIKDWNTYDNFSLIIKSMLKEKELYDTI